MRYRSATPPGIFKYRRMQELVEKKGLTTRALAAAVDADRVTVRRWAAGEAEPSPRFLVRLAEALGVQPRELYTPRTGRPVLAYYRVLAGYSLAQLAPLLGTSPVHLGRMESGHAAILPHVLEGLTEHLGLSKHDLLELAKVVRIAAKNAPPPAAAPCRLELPPAAARELLRA